MPKPVTSAKPSAKKPAPAPVEKVELSFSERLRLIDRAGYGVILTRTREPVRVLDVLKQYAFTRKNPTNNELDSSYRVWDCVRGWVEYPVTKSYKDGAVSIEEGDPSVASDETDITAALGLIQDVKNLGKDPWKTGFYVFNYPHFHIKENAEFIVTLKSYCHSLPTGRSRVILVVPEGFSMPSELEDDITILDFTVPNQEELTERFDSLLDELDKANPYDAEEVQAITSAGLGMTELDFEQAIALAIAENAGGDVTAPISAPLPDFLRVIYRCKTEAVKRTNILELVDPMPMTDIGGMENVKSWCIERRDWLTPEARAFGLRAPRGALVTGVPGTGKSLIPRGIAHVFNIPCVRMDVGKVFNKYVGESEARMDMALAFIRAIRPCVVWVDEMDKAGLGTDSGNDSSQRVLAKLLTFMQESPDGIFWVPTANRVEKIPTELMRPGRIDIIFGVVLPNANERKAVFEIHLRKRRQDFSKVTDIAKAVEASNGYSPAEIEAAVNNAVGYAFTHKVKITGELLAKHVKFLKPQSVSHAADIEKIVNWCKHNAIPSSEEVAKEEDRAVPATPGNKGKRTWG